MGMIGRCWVVAQLVLVFALAACGQVPSASSETGQLAVSLGPPGSTHDVAAISYKVVAEGDTCEGTAIATATAVLDPTAIAAGGGLHHFGDHFFVLPPGSYRICATPLKADGTPSAVCGPAVGVSVVIAGATTEVTLVSQCQGTPTGGGDTVVVLNDPPMITGLGFAPGKFITACETATITVTAEDPNGDAFNAAWSIVTQPAGSAAELTPSGLSAIFTPDLVGEYGLTVTVTDALGGASSLSFPIHVTGDCPCVDVNFALNTSASGYPDPTQSDRGWGGGSYPWDIVDGHHSYDTWARGLAFTGGHYNTSGGGPWIEPAGVRHAIIDLGASRVFHKIIMWWHGAEHTPDTGALDYWDGSQWLSVGPFERTFGTMYEEGTNSGLAYSDIYTFSTVAGSKVRYTFDNSGYNILGTYNVHGWIYEFEVFGCSTASPGP